MRKLKLAGNLEDLNMLNEQEVSWFGKLLEYEIKNNHGKVLEIAPALQFQMNSYEPEDVGPFYINVIEFKKALKQILFKVRAKAWTLALEKQEILESDLKKMGKYDEMLLWRKEFSHYQKQISEVDGEDEKGSYAGFKEFKHLYLDFLSGIKNSLVSERTVQDVHLLFGKNYNATSTVFVFLNTHGKAGWGAFKNFFSSEDLQELYNNLSSLNDDAYAINASLSEVVMQQVHK